MDRLSRTQRLASRLVPRRVFASMERHSKSWGVTCDQCGHRQSVWEMGGIRWMASGNPKRMLKCLGCGVIGMRMLERAPLD